MHSRYATWFVAICAILALIGVLMLAIFVENQREFAQYMHFAKFVGIAAFSLVLIQWLARLR